MRFPQGREVTAARDVLPGPRDAAIAAVYIGAYIALDWVSYIHPLAQLAITPWNPPPGLSLFLLLRFGLRFIPALFIAAFLADVLIRGDPLAAPLTFVISALLASGYAAVGALLVRRFGNGAKLRTLRDVNGLVAAAGIGPAVIGLAYVGINTAVGRLPSADFPHALLQFWIGDAIGIVVTTPVLLEFAARRPALRVRLHSEAAFQAMAVVLALWTVFGMSATDEFKFFYLLFLPLIWVAMRRGMRGAVLASLAMQVGLIAAADRIAAKGLLLWELQLLMLTLALTALYLGMAVTERRDAQRAMEARDAALDRALRMATAGELTAGIAHEVNQPLTAIGTYVRACIAMIDDNSARPALRETLDKVTREVARAGAVIRQLREFFRTGTARRELVAPGALIDAVIASLASRAAEHQVAISISSPPDLPAIAVDQIQMQIVFRNLLTNAIDALADSSRPQRLVRVSLARNHPEMLTCEIADNGPGISAELADRLFEPFVSTKTDGMGFGLAISRSIVEAHGGTLVLERRDHGATFRIALPFADDHE